MSKEKKAAGDPDESGEVARTRTNPRIHARRVAVARQHGRRRLRRTLVVLLAASLAALGLDVVHSSVLGARHVRVFGVTNISARTIVDTAGLASAPPLVDIDTAVIAARVERLPWVAAARVRLAWPTTVDIDVTERVPVAVLAEPGGAGWAVVDDLGRVLQTMAGKPSGLPVIGLPVGAASDQQTYSAGLYVPASLEELAVVAAALPESMVAEVGEITTSPAGVIIEMPKHPLAIVGNSTSLQQKFVSLATVLARTDLNGVSAIDLRVPASPVLLSTQSSRIVAGHDGG